MDVRSLIAQWRQYATANKSNAAFQERDGDLFGAELARARGEVRLAAAEMLQRMTANPMGAAKLMHDNARGMWQHSLPLIGFDPAAIKYTKARTWQDCARAIDPSLPVVQPQVTWE